MKVRLLVDWEMDPSALTHPWRGINSSRVCQDVLPVEIIFDIMVRETNRYADQYFQGKGGVGITFVLYMGMVKLPTCPIQYWSSHRFLNIMIFLLLHCADNSAPPPWNSSQYDRLHKVTEVVDTAIGAWQSCYYPKQESPESPLDGVWKYGAWSTQDLATYTTGISTGERRMVCGRRTMTAKKQSTGPRGIYWSPPIC